MTFLSTFNKIPQQSLRAIVAWPSRAHQRYAYIWTDGMEINGRMPHLLPSSFGRTLPLPCSPLFALIPSSLFPSSPLFCQVIIKLPSGDNKDGHRTGTEGLRTVTQFTHSASKEEIREPEIRARTVPNESILQ